MGKRETRRQRPLHKKLLLHPAAIFLMLCFGVILMGASFQTSALDISVIATVNAPKPTEPANIRIVAPITQPWLQQTVSQGNSAKSAIVTTSKSVTLSGDCPKASHLQFYRNGLFAGVAACIGDPTFSIILDLAPGLNLISTRVFNITNNEGPLSAPVYLYYQPPSQQPVKGGGPLILSSDFSYLGFLVSGRASWNVIINGGVPPYQVNVSWGDGSKDSYKAATAGTLDIFHTYTKASGPTGYTIFVQATDASDQKATLALLTIISKPGSDQAKQIDAANAALHPGFFARLKKWLWLAWPAYVIVMLMMVSFWLGEREEYYRIVKKIRRKKRK